MGLLFIGTALYVTSKHTQNQVEVSKGWKAAKKGGEDLLHQGPLLGVIIMLKSTKLCLEGADD